MPVKWSEVTKLEDTDIQTTGCVAYGQTHQSPPLPPDRAEDTIFYEIIPAEQDGQ